ncbi:MAG: hypothetical protein WC948_03315 [Thermovirgaceae bacterium]|jgi:hypothetical protein|nr:hypothetical protein [Thermovirga sp.]
MGILPYWDQNMDLDIAPWTPYAKDFNPVSVNLLHSDQLGKIASLALGMDSELLFVESTETGQVGPLFRENLLIPGRRHHYDGGFSLIFGYSAMMEALLGLFAQVFPGVSAGLAVCGVWDRFMLVDECKVIVLVGDSLLLNESKCFLALQEIMAATATDNGSSSFFAEQFGYRRFSIPFETDDITSLAISKILFDFELDATHALLGPPPEVSLPDIFREREQW